MAEDAVPAVKAGTAAVQVSNHGRRALHGTPATLTVLSRIADANARQRGIWRDMDIAKALALGANLVAVGKPVCWALTVAVAGPMHYFNRELVNTSASTSRLARSRAASC